MVENVQEAGEGKKRVHVSVGGDEKFVYDIA
jgi:hypothetical protein